MQIPFLSCVHTHTHYCDGKDAPEAMVQKAIELGFVSLGFSGHGPSPLDDFAMDDESVQSYRTEIQQLQKKYEGQLEILLGIEHDALSPYPADAYEYIIDSVHNIWKDGMLCVADLSIAHTQEIIQNAFDGDPYAYAKAYFEACAACYEHSPAQIAGHIDLLTKFNEQFPLFDETDPRFLKPALEAVNSALDHGLILEVNSGAISRGYRTTPYPSNEILKHILQRGAQVIVTSDCHDCNHLTCHYDEIAENLKTLGFRSTLRLRKHGFEEIPL